MHTYIHMRDRQTHTPIIMHNYNCVLILLVTFLGSCSTKFNCARSIEHYFVFQKPLEIRYVF